MMRRRLLMRVALTALASAATPALAQHGGHDAHAGHAMQAPTPTPAPAPENPHAGHDMGQMGHSMAPPATPAEPAPGPHAGHHMPAAPQPPVADPHAGHAMPAPSPAPVADPHAGHQMPSAPTAGSSHAGHAPTLPNPPVLPTPAAAMGGPVHAADGMYDPAAMTRARSILRDEHGNMRYGMVMLDRIEAHIVDGRNGYVVEGDAWYGGDIDRAWLKFDGEGQFGGQLEHVSAQALWSHALDPWFNLQLGVRQDIGHGPDRSYAVIGVNGLAPYFFEVDGAMFVSTKGDVTAKLEAEYDQRLTQKLILQPAAELNLSAQRVPELGLGSGVTSTSLGLRMRYEFVPEFAPYLGVAYERRFGQTARYQRAAGEAAGGWAFIMGLRAWF